MNSKIKILLLFSFFLQFCYAQPILWQKNIGGSSFDNASYFENTTDGCYLVVGTTRSNDGDLAGRDSYSSDMFVSKVNSKGKIIWKKFIGGSLNDEGNFVKVTSDGGYIIVGSAESNSDIISGHHGKKDFLVVRMDALGKILWAKCYGGKGNETANSVIQTKDGGFVVVGTTGSNTDQVKRNRGGNDCWVIKLDWKGELTWEVSLGGPTNENVVDVLDVDDGYLICGSTDSDQIGEAKNHGKTDILLAKINTVGGVDWHKMIGGDSFDEPHGLTLSFKKEIMLVGTTFSNTGDVKSNKGRGDIWVISMDKFGKIVWEKTYGGTMDEGGNAISQSFDGNFLIAGTTGSSDGDLKEHKGLYDAWAIKINPKGDIVWQKVFGGNANDNFKIIKEIPNGDYLGVGTVESQDGDLQFVDKQGGPDIWLLNMRDPISPPQAISLTPTTLLGYIKDKTTKKFIKAEVYLVDDKTGKKISTATSDTTYGVYQIILPDTNQMSVGYFAPGYIFHSEIVTIKPDQRYSEVRIDIELDPIKKGSVAKLNNIYFDIGKTTLRPESFPELDRLVMFMKANQTVKIQINGHTDASGAHDTKQKLSELRAGKVKEYLITKGIQQNRLTFKGFGKDKPLVEEVDEATKQQNRRVEIEIVGY